MKALFTPGPVKMSERTLDIGGMQTPYFRNKAFSDVLLECEENLLKLAHAPEGSRAVFLTASGTAAMEATVMNLLNREDKAIVINGGGFGQRFVDICQIHDIPFHNVKVRDTNLASTQCLEPLTGSTALCVNAHETTIGLLYDLTAIGEHCRRNNLLNIIDAISLFITDPIDMQAQSIDAMIVSSHKGLALPPGLSMVILSPRAMERIKPVQSLYFNFQEYLKDGTRGQTPFTPAITIILQLQDRLRQIVNEGIEKEHRKTKEIAAYFRESINGLPLQPFTQFMPNAMTTLTPTDGKKAFEIVERLDKEFNIVVTPNGGELKDTVFRVSHMGDITKEYTDKLINALFTIYGEKQ